MIKSTFFTHTQSQRIIFLYNIESLHNAKQLAIYVEKYVNLDVIFNVPLRKIFSFA